MNTFNEKMKIARMEKKLSQRELGEMLGIKKQNIQEWESGTREPSIGNALKIAEALNVSLDYLTGRTNNPKINKCINTEKMP